jgi:hypothetical protein
MTKRTTIIVTSLILVAAVTTAGVMVRRDNSTPSQTTNAPVSTGVSLVFDAPLASEFIATVTDSSNTVVKEVTLEKNASRFNLDLPSGVYTIGLKARDNSITPLPPETVTVGDGVLSELHINMSHEDE